ncbi:MAG: orotate phosphoribosyltransferase [Actinobacteria bacterium]|nr:orotate phosphoribosyltransferase [Actinomycetota bacterium]
MSSTVAWTSLRQQIVDKAVVHGKVILSSGREADYYVDLRRVTLDAVAAPLVGDVMREVTSDWEYEAVGGLTLGADPVATAMLHSAARAGRELDAFVVRKSEKTHGLQQRIEGPDVSGRRVLAVEDTSTTGGSVLTAVDALLRNVVDQYRFWKVEAIVEDLDSKRHPMHVAIENLEHDFNIGSIVRTANAFLAREVHIVGRKRWNRRGAMVTDRYQNIRHHESVDALSAWANENEVPIIGLDNVPGAISLETFDMPRSCVLFFGQEGQGLSEAAQRACSATVSIAQFGSTRSINVGAAAAIAMHAWIRRHTFGQVPTEKQ